MSLSAAVLDAMVASGISVEQLVAVIKADMADEAARKARQVPWPQLRIMAFERDGEVCGYCSTEEGPFEIDHIIPRAKGGEDVLDNVRVACRACNRSKKDADESEWTVLQERRKRDRERKRVERAGKPERVRAVRGQSKDNTDPLEVSPHTPLPNPPNSSPPISPRKKRGAPAPTVAPDWVPAEPWAAFDEMRQSMKHKWPWSEKAAKGIWDDLDGFRAAGHDIGAILMNSVKKGYRGVFAPDRPTPTVKPAKPIRELTAEEHENMAKFQDTHDPAKAAFHRGEAERARKARNIGSLIPEVRATH